ncbi:MAG TPA: ABC transporter permease [Dehalococcoidia bacterium]|nr:ABC transporter permease [Dehalococcoidia bacterium]
MSLLMMTLRQGRYDNRSFWRNPAAAFFTFVFPIMFLVIFNLVFNSEIDVPGGEVSPSTFYVPAIVALSIINACYTNIAWGIVAYRDRGILKRLRGTPLPTAAYLGGRILQAIWVAVVLVVLVLAIGVIFYGVDLPGERMPAFIVSLMVGAACFCALGMALSAAVPNEDAAPAVINGSILPLLFISNVFIPTSNAPGWLNDFASLLPVVHLANALHASFNPFVSGSGFEWKDLAVMATWAAFGIAISMRYFSWEPRK